MPVPDGSRDETYYAGLPDNEKEALNRVRKCMEWAKPLHDACVPIWKENYGLYRNVRDFRRSYSEASDRDQGGIILDAQREWGAELFIPLIFSAIETITPRVLAQNPSMTVKPRDPQSQAKVNDIKETLEQQQIDIDYELKLQPTARRGFKYGLGVNKTYWQTTKRTVTKKKKRIVGGYSARDEEITVYDGPQMEDVEIFDFYWDPAARSIETARWVIHRTWRDSDYIKRKMESGEWKSIPADKWLTEAGPETGAFDDRPALNSIDGIDVKAGKRHEVWEFHDREYVITVLNGCYLVQMDVNPAWSRELPFQIFRPTIQEGEFVGISEIEPVKHLQYEINTLRSQRRDNATAVLDQVTLYAEGFIDQDLLKKGPGALIPTVGDPRDAIFQLPQSDIPASGYREEDALKSDFDRATGISDPIMGVGSAETATGQQLMQDAANARLTAKGKNLMNEVVRPASRRFYELNQQHILTPRTIRVDDDKAEEGYNFKEIGPDTFDADVDIIPDVGSMEPDNPTQRKNDAMTVYNLLAQRENVDQDQLLAWFLEQNDVPEAKAWITSQDKVGMVLEAAGEELRNMGIPDEDVVTFMQNVLEQSGIQPAGEGEGAPAPEGDPVPPSG